MLIEMILEGGPHDGLKCPCDSYPRAELTLPAAPREHCAVVYKLTATEVRGSVRPGVLLHYRFKRYIVRPATRRFSAATPINELL